MASLHSPAMTNRPTPQDVKAWGFRQVRRVAERAGLQVVPNTFYSPIPDRATLESDVWNRRATMAGIGWDLEAQMRWLEHDLAPAMATFSALAAAAQRTRPDQYHLDNGLY